MYSVRNYSPYFKIIYNGKDSKKEYIYIKPYTHTHIYISESLMLHTGHCKSAILK